ncbi:hypothetical protein DEO72_LG5g562 [Vigna unguiculata]|uniref:Uncharacterized protein n=1 Tax=Vigna unguiculata TaxID=3917 RepID=A0A4D6LV29_VIGUN|nr:hypothetical protein DEO72_LG2g3076 [Vigna unguiculata]QCD92497.1 hypothetical protein DEO72_LG5g562 [Vigna unguiculata]
MPIVSDTTAEVAAATSGDNGGDYGYALRVEDLRFAVGEPTTTLPEGGRQGGDWEWRGSGSSRNGQQQGREQGRQFRW